MHGFVSEKHHVSFFKFGRASVHFRLFCRVDKYSPFHLVQNRSESVCTRFYSDLYISLSVNSPRFLETHASGVFCESNVAGVRIKGVAASVETDTNGLLLIIADTSAIKVASTSWVRFPSCILESIESSILLAEPIIRSHAPPMWEEQGELNIHVLPVLRR